ncbi:response regulator transcription factor [Eubacterium sp. An11]|uniref:response regulator transcription factor n=1 Tax=Eubacterium sp. An11 TaxID=1965542 RepID=UPI0013A602C5|nr:response regulator transcription factor [Eubacterium sp. An11]
MRRNTIFLMEKNVEYIKEFCRFFENDYDILYSSDGEKAMEIYAENNTDIHLIILDSNLCEKKRCDILEELRSFCDVPVIMLMENEEPEPQIVAYRMGADECVSSYVSFPLLKMKIEAILKRVYGTDNSIQEGILELDLDKRTLKVDNEYIDITIKEFELLSFFMRNKHAIQSRDQIITAVWGINYEGSDRVVDSLVKKLRLKLKDASNYIHTAYGMGYYFELPIKEPA